jgi:hypothetical protein
MRTEVRCQDIHGQLAVYRELSRAEQDQLQVHLDGCARCAATLAAYQAQDQLLAALPVVSPTPALTAGVRTRTVGRRQPARRPARRPLPRWAAAALTLLLLSSVVAGTVSIAADTLPGDSLYPVKRGAEQLRLALTLEPAARDQYRLKMLERRREEVGELIRLKRKANVEFEGAVEAIGDGVWLVNGFEVAVTAGAWTGGPPPTGSIVAVAAQVADGQVIAARVRLSRPPVQAPVPPDEREEPVLPSPTPTRTDARTLTSTPTRTPRIPGKTGPGRQRAVTPTTGDRDPQRTGTPGHPVPWQTPSPGADDPGVQRTPTRPPGGPVPRPSATRKPVGPGPRPSVTPVPRGPRPRPPVTPVPQGPGPAPSVTPFPRGPRPRPSATPIPRGPGPRRSPAPGSSGAAPGRGIRLGHGVLDSDRPDPQLPKPPGSGPHSQSSSQSSAEGH